MVLRHLQRQELHGAAAPGRRLHQRVSIRPRDLGSVSSLSHVTARARVAFAAALLCVTAGLVACSCSRGRRRRPALVVETEHGKVKGINEDGIRAWRGIPYAAPPVGDLRWRAAGGARRLGRRPQRRAVRRHLPPDHVPAPGQTGASPQPDSAEDCLYPQRERPRGGRRPAGDGVDPRRRVRGRHRQFRSLANSPAVVKRGVVLVTINYRLGRLGFFAHPSLRGRRRELRAARPGRRAGVGAGQHRGVRRRPRRRDDLRPVRRAACRSTR